MIFLNENLLLRLLKSIRVEIVNIFFVTLEIFDHVEGGEHFLSHSLLIVLLEQLYPLIFHRYFKNQLYIILIQSEHNSNVPTKSYIVWIASITSFGDCNFNSRLCFGWERKMAFSFIILWRFSFSCSKCSKFQWTGSKSNSDIN